ncbi:MAG: right-handed parallel beta-helix repeat-containing protein, partial [Thermoplasmata archaeon]
MRKRKYTSFALGMVLSFLGLGLSPYPSTCDSFSILSHNDTYNAVFLPHHPIVIEKNSDFTYENGVIGGNGTREDPYIICSWEINGENGYGCIIINNTSAYLIIMHCKLHDAISGIFISNASHINIKSNIISGSMYGTYIPENATDIEIRQNIYYNITKYGIKTGNSSILNLISGNIFIHCGEQQGAGIYIEREFGEGGQVIIERNFFGFNRGGVVLSATTSLIENNILLENHCGIYAKILTTGCNVTHNLFVNNNMSWATERAGFSSPVNNVLHHNIFFNTSADGVGTLPYGWTLWNTTDGGNYWWDWLTPDNNSDGFVDIPRRIDPTG